MVETIFPHRTPNKPRIMFKSNFYLVICVVAFLLQKPSASFSQSDYIIVTQDLEAWTSARLKYKVNKKITLGLSQGVRLNTNASITDQILTEFGFKYAFNKHLYFGTDLRYIADKNNSGEFDNDFRFNLDFGVKQEWTNRKGCIRW